jgi:hypothetical protein
VMFVYSLLLWYQIQLKVSSLLFKKGDYVLQQ